MRVLRLKCLQVSCKGFLTKAIGFSKDFRSGSTRITMIVQVYGVRDFGFLSINKLSSLVTFESEMRCTGFVKNTR
jgi:hypothetical protein